MGFPRDGRVPVFPVVRKHLAHGPFLAWSMGWRRGNGRAVAKIRGPLPHCLAGSLGGLTTFSGGLSSLECHLAFDGIQGLHHVLPRHILAAARDHFYPGIQ
jgi:hypothetical protein